MEKEIKVGSSIRVGLAWLIVSEIDGDMLWCIDPVGHEMEVSIHRVDHIYDYE
jgi:hypothetical protein